MNEDIREKFKEMFDQCVGCGHCCVEARCTASVRLYRSADICPLLIWDYDDDRYYCDLMLIPGNLGETYRKELYANIGCPSNLNSWRKNVKRRTKEIDSKVNINLSPIRKEFQIFLNVLGRQWISGDLVTFTIDSFISELKKRDYNSDEAEKIGAIALNYIKNNQSSFREGFMG